MTRDELQEVIPAGLEVLEERIGARAFGQVFLIKDTRLGGPPARRIARVLEFPGEAPPVWIGKLEERLAKLTGRLLPHVSLPTEAGRLRDGSFLILSPYHDECSRASLTKNQLDTVVEQLLVGLTALHHEALPHGDVRPQNLFLDRGVRSECNELWLVDAAIGPLTHWSDGTLLDANAARYYPPEWKTCPQAPGSRADLYALGLTICELAVGSDVRPLPAEAADAAPWHEWILESVRAHLPFCWMRDLTAKHSSALRDSRECLAKVQASWSTRVLVSRLLADDPDDRPADASEALAEWRHSRRSWERLRAGGGVAIACVLIGVLLWTVVDRRYRHDAKQAADKLADSAHRLTDAGKELQELRSIVNDVRRLPADTTSIREQVVAFRQEFAEHAKSTSPDPQPSDDARKRAEAQWSQWRKGLRGPRHAKELSDQLGKVEKQLGDSRLDPAVHAQLANLVNVVKGICAPGGDSAVWFDNDDEQRKRVQAVLDEPWNIQKVAHAKENLEDLKIAFGTWEKWANGDRSTPDQIEKEIDLKRLAAPREATILARWWLSVRGNRTWTLSLVSGTCVPGWGIDRRVWVGSGPTSAHGAWHKWSTPVTNPYPTPPTPGFESIGFGWEPGDPIRVVMECGSTVWRGGARPNLIDETTAGPLALWKLASKPKPLSTYGNTLSVAVPNCPGPPLALPSRTPPLQTLGPATSAPGPADTPPPVKGIGVTAPVPSEPK